MWLPSQSKFFFGAHTWQSLFSLSCLYMERERELIYVELKDRAEFALK